MEATLAAWVGLVREDTALVVNEYLPEMLVVAVMSLLFWFIRKRLTHASRPRF